jgi:BMFP domain-containing protein YqiC
MAAFEARMAGLEKRFEETSARAKTAETDLAKAREDLAAAQKRVAELEESRPPSHVREDDGAPAPKTPSEPAATKRNWGKGMLSGWSARPTDGDDSE